MAVGNDVRSWTVLVVDDEPDNSTIAEKIFTFNGATVRLASNGIEGLLALKEITPSFILLDLSMPRMDGWAMLEKIRENPVTRNIPVIALTAHAMDGDKERVLSAGFNGYIAKPFRYADFLAEIKQCLGIKEA
jgi:two-component system, cell cycle response regulator DivK